MDDVGYLEKMTFDFDGCIFRNLHGKFLTKSPFFSPQQSNGKNELVKALFISFLDKWIVYLFIFHYGKVFFEAFYLFQTSMSNVLAFVQDNGSFRENSSFFTEKTSESPLSSFLTPKIWKDRRAFLFKLVKMELKRWSSYSPFLTVKTRKDCRIFVVSNSIWVIKRRVLDHFFTFQIRDIKYEKYSLVVKIKRFSQVLFYTFSGLRDTNLRKRTTMEFSYAFSDSIKLKTLSFSYTRLVKI